MRARLNFAAILLTTGSALAGAQTIAITGGLTASRSHTSCGTSW